MSRKNKERRERNRLRRILVFPEGHDITYSLETMQKLASLQADPGPHPVAIFHEQFCVDAIKAGAKRCMCNPEVKIVEKDSHIERERRAFKTHWLNETGGPP